MLFSDSYFINISNPIKNRSIDLFKSKRWSDCYFSVGSTAENRKVFEAHKLILSMASPVFDGMLSGQFAQTECAIDVLDVEPELFGKLLEYIYTDEIIIATFDEAIAMCYVAKKYMLTQIMDHCVSFVGYKLSVSNVCRAYEFANLYDKKNLIERCIQIIKNNTNSILNDHAFLDININTLKDIFHLNHLQIDTELSLFNALQRYAKNKGLQKDVCKDYDEYRELLKAIRFLSMTSKEFADGPAKSELLEQDEKFAIIMNVSSDDVKNVPMPEGFSANKNCRKSSKIFNLSLPSTSTHSAVDRPKLLVSDDRKSIRKNKKNVGYSIKIKHISK